MVLFVVSGHSKCHGPNVFSLRIDRVDNWNVMAVLIKKSCTSKI